MKLHHVERLALALVVRLGGFRIRVGQQRKDEAVHAGGRLDDVRDVLTLREAVGVFLGLSPGLVQRHAHLGEILEPGRVVAILQFGLLLGRQLAEGRAQLLVEHAHGLAGAALVLREVEVAAGGDAFQLLRSEGELEENVHAGAGIVRQLLGLLPILLQRGARQADALVELDALLDPILVPELPAPVRLRLAGMALAGGRGDRAADGLDRLVRLDEEFQFHLLELARTEGVVARRHLVAERLAHLRDAEGHLLPRRLVDILELREDGLRGLGTKIGHVRLRGRGADVGLEHQVEGDRRSQQGTVLRVEALGAFDLLHALAEQLHRLQAALRIKLSGGLASTLRRLARSEQHSVRLANFLARHGVLRAVVVIGVARLQFDLVRAKPLLRQQAVAHRITERVHMAGCAPDGRVHDDGRFKADHVVAHARHGGPPQLLHVALQLRAERAVIPKTLDAAVDLGGLKNEPAPLAQRRDLLHQHILFRLGHRERSFRKRRGKVKGCAVGVYRFGTPRIARP